MRGLKELGEAPALAEVQECTLLLLGGARCSNSAMSTKDTVYKSGRRLAQIFRAAGCAERALTCLCRTISRGAARVVLPLSVHIVCSVYVAL
jgi:hypothetical protein